MRFGRLSERIGRLRHRKHNIHVEETESVFEIKFRQDQTY